jgi:N-dimethylarginine dimethylaminohydrolase
MQTVENKQAGFGGQSMVATLQRVLIRRPDHSLGNADPKRWHYSGHIDLSTAIIEHDHFAQILQNQHVEIVYHDQQSDSHADSIFVHDPALITDHGAIIMRMGKILRNGEEALIKQALIALGVPIIGELTSPALAEGGDFIWLDEHTLIAGKGFRTNDEGIHQLRAILSPFGITLLDFDLSYYQGQDACLHLQSLISLVDVKTALVYLPLLPTRLYTLLKERHFTLIEVPESEFATMAPNVLAIKPKVVLSIDTNTITKKRLEEAGITVFTYQGQELSLKTEGGPTCLTRPLKRASSY